MTSLNSSLVKQETSEPSTAVHISHPRYGSPEHDSIPSIDPEESCFRHQCWAADRRRVYNALCRTNQGERRTQAFADCGSGLWLQHDGSGLVLTCNHCHDRLCLVCQLSRRARLVEAILVAMVDAKKPVRFVTLTLKHNHTPLADQLDRLYRSFKVLRRRPLWKNAVTGGAMFLEVKVGADNLWHPHLHILCETDWLDQVALCKDWYAVTGDSFRCDVRPVPDAKRRAEYVTKYATKPCDFSVLHFPERLDEFVVAIKGRRLYQPFGSWTALLPKDSDETPKVKLKPLGSVYTLASNAAAGDPDAQCLWAQALAAFPRLSVFTPHPTHTDADPAPP